MSAENSPFLLHQKFQEQALKFPEKIVVEYYLSGKYTSYRYRDLQQQISLLVDLLHNAAVKKDDRIAIISENRPEWISAYFSTLCAGAVNVPIDPQLTNEEVISILIDAEVKIVFTSLNNYQRIEKFRSQVPALRNILNVDNISAVSGLKTPEGITRDLNSLVSILYTSGTTAVPKGVMLSHKNLSSNFNSIKKVGITGPEDIFIAILPFHHIYPFMVTLLFPVLSGIKVVIAQTLKGPELLQIIREKGVTILPGVPQLFKMISDGIKTELKKLPFIVRTAGVYFIRRKLHKKLGRQFRFFLSGGAKLDEKTARNLFSLGLPIIEGYGLTETSPVVTISPLKKPKIGSAGKAIPEVEINIDKPDTSGIGEIIIKGQNIMEGYYKRPEETNEAVKNGWFHSGDLGHIDKEGYLYITGRLKEIIVLSSGKNIYPEELESFYAQIPFLKEICIIGRPLKDRLGISSSLWALTLPDMEFYKKTGDINIHDSIEWALKAAIEKQPSYRRLSGFTIVREEFPRTRLGKIKRYEVEKKYRDVVIKQITTVLSAEPAKPEDEYLIKSPVGEKVLDNIEKQLKPKKRISINDHLELDLGIDSLGRVELLLAIENSLKAKLPDKIMAESFTVKDLIMKINSHIEQPVKEPLQPETAYWGEILKQPPAREYIRKIDLSPGPISHILNFIAIKTFYLLYKAFWSLKIYGKSNIPKDCPFIICSNHQSFLDGPIISCTIPFRIEMRLFFIGYRIYFELPLLKKLVRMIRIIPINTSTDLVEALRASIFVLDNKKSLCIFPEGARSPDGNLQEFKKGIGILTKHKPVKIVPVYISGSYKSWPIVQKLPRPCPITIRYGHPLEVQELLNKGFRIGAKDDYTAISMALRKEIEKLVVGDICS